MECLLALIEMMQFQEYVIKHMDTEEMVHVNDIKRIVFASNIPQSCIMEENVDFDNVHLQMIIGDKFTYSAKVKIYKIYQRYIRYEIHFPMCMIPFHNRNRQIYNY